MLTWGPSSSLSHHHPALVPEPDALAARASSPGRAAAAPSIPVPEPSPTPAVVIQGAGRAREHPEPHAPCVPVPRAAVEAHRPRDAGITIEAATATSPAGPLSVCQPTDQCHYGGECGHHLGGARALGATGHTSREKTLAFPAAITEIVGFDGPLGAPGPVWRTGPPHAGGQF